jgi:hypothetical protein
VKSFKLEWLDQLLFYASNPVVVVGGMQIYKLVNAEMSFGTGSSLKCAGLSYVSEFRRFV